MCCVCVCGLRCFGLFWCWHDVLWVVAFYPNSRFTNSVLYMSLIGICDDFAVPEFVVGQHISDSYQFLDGDVRFGQHL